MPDKKDSMLLLARLAVAQKMVTRETADRVVELARARDTDIPFGELLLQLGHITGDQFKQLMALHYAERKKGETRAEQELFGEAVVARGLATPDQVSSCLREQAELGARGIFKNLGEIMVERGMLTGAQVKLLLEEQDKVIAFCPQCGEKFNVLRPWLGDAKCPTDSSSLLEARSDESVGVAATLGAKGDVAGSPIGMEVGGCKVVELIAKGSMGTVYKAKHVGLNRWVAVKMLPSVSQNPALVKRLLFEARAVAKLEHPNVVQVYDVGFQKGYFFIVMQLLNGQTLEGRVAETGVPPLDTALGMVKDVAQGLKAAHERGIVHRDLKPANIIITEDGRARLTDFGLAQDTEHPEDQGMIVGTPYYMSPEQWLGHKADERSDLYSLGVIFYQLVTGRRPFDGETVNDLMHQHLKVQPRSPQSYDESLSNGLCAVVRKLLAKAPAKRYGNAGEFLKDLEKVMRDEDPDAVQEFGKVVKCGFCESYNPAGEKRCKVCNEPLHSGGGPIEIALRPDEFKCPGCGGLNAKGARACATCRKAFCQRCRKRLAVLKGYCHDCIPHLRKR